MCQLTSGDYIVSNRMAVKRKTASGKSGFSKIYPEFSFTVTESEHYFCLLS